MRKLTLNLDALQVDSFSTAAGEESRGTVQGNSIYQTNLQSCNHNTGGCNSCYQTCTEGACGSQYNTYVESCVPGACPDSYFQACATNGHAKCYYPIRPPVVE